MPQKVDPVTVLATRLRTAREQKGLSQRQLGIAVGLDPFVASTRINRYERAVHFPDPVTVQRIADALGVPAAYLFTSDERLARLILAYNAMSVKAQERLISQIESMVEK